MLLSTSSYVNRMVPYLSRPASLISGRDIGIDSSLRRLRSPHKRLHTEPLMLRLPPTASSLTPAPGTCTVVHFHGQYSMTALLIRPC